MSLHRIWQVVTGAMSSWHEGKVFVEHTVAVDHDALHVVVGVLAWLAFGAVLRRPLSSWRPWICVLALILWNETVDLWTERWPDAGMQYGEGAKDLLMTMLLPTLLMVLLRVAPGLFTGSRTRR